MPSGPTPDDGQPAPATQRLLKLLLLRLHRQDLEPRQRGPGPHPALVGESVAALSLRAADLPAELAATGHEICEEDEDVGYVMAVYKGRSGRPRPGGGRNSRAQGRRTATVTPARPSPTREARTTPASWGSSVVSNASAASGIEEPDPSSGWLIVCKVLLVC
ncbi:hypothetical protein ZWY2020_004189 [Hordeum vulgare]|nr:hypothetical protein ZWY2020_004189 [Hordeum vulgare]